MFKIVQLLCCVFLFKNSFYPDTAVTAVLSSVFQSNTTCYGKYFNVACGAGQVIAIYNITVGTKKISTTCPDTSNQSCCEVADEDCTFLFDSNKQEKYHDSCNGENNCLKQRADWDQTPAFCSNGTVGDVYYSSSNYMYIYYNCIEQTNIFDMFSTNGINEVLESETVYIWGKNYPNQNEQSDVDEVACSVEIDNCDANVEIFTLDIRLCSESNGTNEQYLKIMDADNTTIIYWNCSNNAVDKNTVSSLARNYFIVYFKRNNSDVGGRFWLGFQPTKHSNISVNCPPEYPTMCERSTSTTPETTTSTTSLSSTTSTQVIQTTSTATSILTTTSTTTMPNATSSTNAQTVTSTTQTTTPATATDTATSTTSMSTSTSSSSFSSSTTSSSSTSTIMTTSLTSSITYIIDSKYDWMPIVIGLFVGIIIIIIIILISWYCRNYGLCQRKQYQNSIVGNGQNGHSEKKTIPTSEIISEVEQQKAAKSVPIIAAKSKAKNTYKTKSYHTERNDRESGALTISKKKIRHNKSGNPATKDQKANMRPSSSTSVSKRKSDASSERNKLEAKQDTLPRQTRALFTNQDDFVSGVARERPVSATQSYRRKRRRSHKEHSTFSRERHRSYPRPKHDSYRSESEDTDDCKNDYDIKEINSENAYPHIDKDVGLVKRKGRSSKRLRHIHKKRNKIRPKSSPFIYQHPPQRQSKPFIFLERDLKVLLGRIANYDENRNMTVGSGDQRLVRSKAMNDLSRKKKPRKKSGKGIDLDRHEIVLGDREMNITSDEDIDEKDNVARSFVSRKWSVKTAAKSPKQKAEIKSLRTTLELMLNSSKLNLTSKEHIW